MDRSGERVYAIVKFALKEPDAVRRRTTAGIALSGKGRHLYPRAVLPTASTTWSLTSRVASACYESRKGDMHLDVFVSQAASP